MAIIDYFRTAIKELMIQKGLSQADFARQIDETQGHVSQFLHGKRTFQTKHEKIEKVFNIPYVEIVKFGQVLSKDKSIISCLKYDNFIKVNGKKIKISTLYSKIRFIFSYDEPEREYLINNINTYYNKIISRKKSSHQIKHKRKTNS